MAEASYGIRELIKQTESGYLTWTPGGSSPAGWFLTLPDKRTVVASRDGILTVSLNGVATRLGVSPELAALLQKKCPLMED